MDSADAERVGGWGGDRFTTETNKMSERRMKQVRQRHGKDENGFEDEKENNATTLKHNKV